MMVWVELCMSARWLPHRQWQRLPLVHSATCTSQHDLLARKSYDRNGIYVYVYMRLSVASLLLFL